MARLAVSLCVPADRGELWGWGAVPAAGASEDRLTKVTRRTRWCTANQRQRRKSTRRSTSPVSPDRLPFQKQYKQKEILEIADELEKYYSMDYSDNGFLSTTLLERLNNVVPINGRAQNSGEAIRSFENVAHMYDDLVFGESRSLLEGRHKPSRNPFDLIDTLLAIPLR